MNRVPIDHRACVDIDGDATRLYLDVGDFLVGVCVLLGNKWSARQGPRQAELVLEMIDAELEAVPEFR